MSADDCLPEHLRGATLARFPSGLSGAEVYRVERDGRAYVLKIAATTGDPTDWFHRLAVLKLAADAGLAPRIVHVDAARRAVVSELVVDRGLFPYLMTPATRPQAIAALGTTIRRVHELTIPAGTPPAEPRAFLERIAAGLPTDYMPAFARAFVDRVLAEPPPHRDEPLVTSHNDLNPTNAIFDGERIVLLDWDAAAPNDRYHDLASVSLFLRFDDASCLALLDAYGEHVTALPERFAYSRRLVAAMCGAIFMHLARTGGYAGATADDTLERSDGLADVYAKLRAGELDAATPVGQWRLGLALIKNGMA
ncbi:MAG TPA: phosphotransferase [Kofleriaceae bacterium]|jgi:aminoglycoside phosphotransferase (APT) family kinase protein